MNRTPRTITDWGIKRELTKSKEEKNILSVIRQFPRTLKPRKYTCTERKVWKESVFLAFIFTLIRPCLFLSVHDHVPRKCRNDSANRYSSARDVPDSRSRSFYQIVSTCFVCQTKKVSDYKHRIHHGVIFLTTRSVLIIYIARCKICNIISVMDVSCARCRIPTMEIDRISCTFNKLDTIIQMSN